MVSTGLGTYIFNTLVVGDVATVEIHCAMAFPYIFLSTLCPVQHIHDKVLGNELKKTNKKN